MHVRLSAFRRTRWRGLGYAAASPVPLLLAPARAVHTFGLRRPVDVVFLDAELRVVKVVAALGPNRIARARQGVAALRLVAGAATLRPGDRLELTPAR